jgi:hypothetical protein
MTQVPSRLPLTVTHNILKYNKYFKNHRFYFAQNGPLENISNARKLDKIASV